MGRITETNYAVACVTMAMVYIAKEKYIMMDAGKRSSFSVNGTWVKAVYRVKRANGSLMSTIVLFRSMSE